jgi:hypothetical protein
VLVRARSCTPWPVRDFDPFGKIDAYEAEQARGKYRQCQTDRGARAAYKDKIENFSSDWIHFIVAGHAEEAEITWPVVEKILGQ